LENILSQIRNIAGKELAIQRAMEFIAMSLLSVMGGQLLGVAGRALMARWGWLRNLVTTIGASRVGRIGGALLKTIIRAGNYMDELSEAGISGGGNLVNLLLAAGGKPGAIIAERFLSGLTGFALRMGLNAAMVGTATYYTTVEENNRFWQFINNPIGFLFPSTQSVGNLGDICEFIDLAIRAYNGQPVSVPGVEVQTYSSQNPISVQEAFARATQPLTAFSEWLRSIGAVPYGLTVEIVSSPQEDRLMEALRPRIQFATTEELDELLVQFRRFEQIFNNAGLPGNPVDIFINFVKSLTSLQESKDFSELKPEIENLIQTVEKYNHIVTQLENLFTEDIPFNAQEAIKNHLQELATKILDVYLENNMDNQLNYSEYHREIAQRALEELDILTSLLSQEHPQLLVGGLNNNGTPKSIEVEHNGKRYTFTVEYMPEFRRGDRARLNIYMTYDENEFTPWRGFLEFVEENLTHGNSQNRRDYARRLSFRFDLSRQNRLYLDITSPYIATALYLWSGGDLDAYSRLYHREIRTDISPEDFRHFLREFYTRYMLRL
jgi:hypothetical protein